MDELASSVIEASGFSRQCCEERRCVREPSPPSDEELALRYNAFLPPLESHEQHLAIDVVLYYAPMPPLTLKSCVNPRLRCESASVQASRIDGMHMLAIGAGVIEVLYEPNPVLVHALEATDSQVAVHGHDEAPAIQDARVRRHLSGHCGTWDDGALARRRDGCSLRSGARPHSNGRGLRQG